MIPASLALTSYLILVNLYSNLFLSPSSNRVSYHFFTPLVVMFGSRLFVEDVYFHPMVTSAQHSINVLVEYIPIIIICVVCFAMQGTALTAITVASIFFSSLMLFYWINLFFRSLNEPRMPEKMDDDADDLYKRVFEGIESTKAVDVWRNPTFGEAFKKFKKRILAFKDAKYRAAHQDDDHDPEGETVRLKQIGNVWKTKKTPSNPAGGSSDEGDSSSPTGPGGSTKKNKIVALVSGGASSPHPRASGGLSSDGALLAGEGHGSGGSVQVTVQSVRVSETDAGGPEPDQPGPSSTSGPGAA